MFFAKTIIAALLIAGASWLAGKRPELAGFIVALPLTTLLVLAFSYAEFKDTEASVAFAKSIFVGIPVSLLFFVPFLLAERLQISFSLCYILGLICLSGGYFIHRFIVGFL